MLGIIGAMDIEVAALKAMVKNPVSQKLSGIEFTRGELNGNTVVICACGVGKVSAAVCAEIMILRYSPDYIINTGVAGTLTPELGVGDIAVGKSVVQHDMDTSALGDPVGYLSGLKMIYLPCDEALAECVRRAAAAENLRVVVGNVATGDAVISSQEKKNEILSHFPDSVCCEMEGGAIGQVCTMNRIPFTILRAISDGADGDAPKDFAQFARMAADRSIKVLTRVVRMLD